MASITDICNLAISHLGISKDIANVTTEQSAEAKACRRFLDIARETVLKDYNWPFATKMATLNLVEEDPNDEWAYSYRYPSDCLYARRILSGFRDDTDLTRIAYKITQDDQGILIYCDVENAILEYTLNTENVDLFSSDFKVALSYRLAHYIAPRITAGDPFSLGDKALQKYVLEIQRASANAFNEDKSSLPLTTDSISARD
jgi:hypothetical protein